MNFKKSMLALVIAFSAGVVQPVVMSEAVAAEQEQTATKKVKHKTRRVPALRDKVYTQLSRAQKMVEEGKVAEGIAELENIESKKHSMNSYETAMLWNAFAFVYYKQEDYAKAVEFFVKLVNEESIPESMEKNTLLSIAQLYLSLGKFDETITYVDRWAEFVEGGMPPKGHLLQAQAYYSAKKYDMALPSINKVIEITEATGGTPKEGWLTLQRAVYYELGQPKEVTKVIEKLVKLYNKPEYWVQLAGMYGEIEEEEKQLAIMEAAYQQGFVKKGKDLRSLAQLYFFSGSPAKAAELLEKALADGVLEKDVKTLEFLAQAWSIAKEEDKAIPVLVAAAEVSDSGNFEQRLGEIYLNMDKYDQAISYTKKALDKGELNNEGNAWLVLGMSYFNQKSFDHSISSFVKAQDVKQSKKMATQWIAYVQRSKEREARL